MILTSLALAFIAFVALALSMNRHHEQVLGGKPGPMLRRYLRSSGTVLVVLSLAPCVADDGWSIGITVWLGVLTLAAMAVLGMLTYQAKALTRMALAAPVVALLPFIPGV